MEKKKIKKRVKVKKQKSGSFVDRFCEFITKISFKIFKTVVTLIVGALYGAYTVANVFFDKCIELLKKCPRWLKMGLFYGVAVLVIILMVENKNLKLKQATENVELVEQVVMVEEPRKIETLKVEEPKEVKKETKEENKPKLENVPVCSTSSVKSYMEYRKITNKDSKQWKYINISGKIKNENGYLMEGEYIGVALGSYFGEIGTKYIFTLDTGKRIKVVKVEEKSDNDTINGCYQKYDKSVIEFVIDTHEFDKSKNGYVYNGNFNNLERFKGNITKIERVLEG